MQADSQVSDLILKLEKGDKRSLARCISFVENEEPGYEELLRRLSFKKPAFITGITGPPGAGKSTLINALAKELLSKNKKLAILAIDPSSPFNHGSIMGDRLRMNEHFLSPDVFIRSMASRGSLGGLAPKVFETADVMRAAGFDHILIETVGVGQSEVEIAALADTTVLVLVPEAGDEIQTLKSGIMEIADIYVVNKSDREGADIFYKNLILLSHAHIRNGWEAPVIKTVATKSEGVEALADEIIRHQETATDRDKKLQVLTEKALTMIRHMRTKDISFQQLKKELGEASPLPGFNLYQYLRKFSGE